MQLEDFLNSRLPPAEEASLEGNELQRLFWKYKGLLKQQERQQAFWASTNENLKLAYSKLHAQEQELKQAYAIIRDDLEAASQIQQAFLPGVSERIRRDLDLAVYHKQLDKVGGDYYDFFMTRNDHYAIAMFDICGHGVSAALIMAYLKAQFLQTMEIDDSPREIIQKVNDLSLEYFRRIKKYATITFVLFENSTIRYVCGGGNGLLFHQRGSQELAKGDSFLGLRDEPFHEFSLSFTAGDILVLCTDGIIESQGKNAQDYSLGRLKHLVNHYADRHVKQILDICVRDYHEFSAKDVDDITLIIIRKKGEDYGSRAEAC